jgi:hypothetical protein
MADFIRRDDVLFALRKAERGGSMTALTRLERAYAEIREMPAADVAEVVRCKDCEYVRPTINVHTGEQAGIWCALHDILNVSPDDYCSRGEKKGGRPCD